MPSVRFAGRGWHPTKVESAKDFFYLGISPQHGTRPGMLHGRVRTMAEHTPEEIRALESRGMPVKRQETLR